MAEGMRRYEVTLRRRTTDCPVQNMRQRRETVLALSLQHAKDEALSLNDNRRYFLVASVRAL